MRNTRLGGGDCKATNIKNLAVGSLAGSGGRTCDSSSWGQSLSPTLGVETTKGNEIKIWPNFNMICLILLLFF